MWIPQGEERKKERKKERRWKFKRASLRPLKLAKHYPLFIPFPGGAWCCSLVLFFFSFLTAQPRSTPPRDEERRRRNRFVSICYSNSRFSRYRHQTLSIRAFAFYYFFKLKTNKIAAQPNEDGEPNLVYFCPHHHQRAAAAALNSASSNVRHWER